MVLVHVTYAFFKIIVLFEFQKVVDSNFYITFEKLSHIKHLTLNIQG